jgi:hypothetical protein
MILSSLRTLLETGGRYPSSSLSRTAECAGVRCDAVTILRRRTLRRVLNASIGAESASLEGLRAATLPVIERLSPEHEPLDADRIRLTSLPYLLCSRRQQGDHLWTNPPSSFSSSL